MATRRDPSSTAHGAPAWRLLSWAGVLLIAATLVIDRRIAGDAMTGSLAILLAASLAALQLRRRLPDRFIFLVVLAALGNGAGGAFEWFDIYPWYDELVHTYTGFAGLAAIGYVYARDRAEHRPGLVRWCALVGLALGIGWEVIEAMMGELAAFDTTTDILLDVVGAAAGGWFARRTLAAA